MVSGSFLPLKMGGTLHCGTQCSTHSENLHTVHSIHTAERVAVCKYAILNEAKTNVILQPLPPGGSVTHLNEHKVIFNHKISSASLHSSPCIITVPYIAKEGS